MIYNTFFVMYLLVSLSLCSCDKNIIPNPDPNPCLKMPCDTPSLIGILDTVWTARIYEDLQSISSNGIFHTKDNVLLNFSTVSNGNLFSFEKNNGKKSWEWNELFTSHFPSSHHDTLRNLLILHNRINIGSVSTMTGKSHRIFTQPIEKTSNPFGQLLGDYYYYSMGRRDESKVWLLRSHIDNFAHWDTIYSLTAAEVGVGRPNIESYNLWTDPETGDSILIFQHRMALPNRVDVLAWNMTKKQVEWRHDDLTKLGNSNHQQIFLHDNKAYFAGGTAFYCFDMKTGEILWQYDHPSGVNTFMYYKIIYARDENLILVRDGGECLHAFHPETGEIVWKIPYDGVTALGSGSPTYSKGIIYYTMDGKLWAIRASNGEILWSEESKLHYNSRFSGDVAIDEERGILYATDRRHLIAIKTYQE